MQMAYQMSWQYLLENVGPLQAETVRPLIFSRTSISLSASLCKTSQSLCGVSIAKYGLKARHGGRDGLLGLPLPSDVFSF